MLSFSLVSVISQSIPPVSIPVSIIDENAGLYDQVNYFCYKDSQGYLWIGSYGGLHRFDGKNMTVYLPDERDSTSILGREVISQIVEDKDHNIWAGTDRGLNCYVRDKGIFQSYTLKPDDEGEFKILGIDGNDQLWFTLDSSIYKFDLEKKLIDSLAFIDLHHLNKEVVWMTKYQVDKNSRVRRTYSYGSYLNDPGMEIHEFRNDSLISEKILFDRYSHYPLVINDVYILNDSLLYIAAREGLFKLNLNTFSLTALLQNTHELQGGFSAIAKYIDSTLIIAGGKGQYLQYDPMSELISERMIFTYEGRHIKNIPKVINVDQEGGIYINLTGKGMAFFHPKNLLFKHRTYTVQRGGEPNGVSLRGGMIELDDGRVLAASHFDGLYLFSSEGALHPTLYDPIPEKYSFTA